MKKILKYISILYLFHYPLAAQVYFNNNYEYNLSNANATTIIETSDGYIFLSSIYSASYNSFLIVKIDPYGDTTWTKEYGNSLYSYSTGASNSIITTYDGNYVFCGSRMDTSNNRDAFLVKFETNGDTLWSRSYGGANFDNANVVFQTSDSGLVITGVTQSYSTGAASDFYMIKTDRNGNFLWQQVFGTTAVEDCVSGQTTLDGGFIMSGRKSNMFHIVKTDANGAFQWQQTYSGTAGVCFIKQLEDSTYLLTGAKSVAGLGYQGCLMKVSKTGAFIWQKNYGGAADDWFYTQPLILTDGSIVIAGQTMPGSVPFGLLIKTDSTGNQQWLRTYYKNTSFDNYFYDLKATADNGFIMSGFCFVTTSDPWVVKVDEFGCEVANCSVGINELHPDSYRDSDDKLVLYPNPANSELTLQIENFNISDLQIEVINLLGEPQKFQISNSKIDVSHFASGVYFVSVSADGKRWVEKFVKE
jgi:hypothetical protein